MAGKIQSQKRAHEKVFCRNVNLKRCLSLVMPELCWARRQYFDNISVQMTVHGTPPCPARIAMWRLLPKPVLGTPFAAIAHLPCLLLSEGCEPSLDNIHHESSMGMGAKSAANK